MISVLCFVTVTLDSFYGLSSGKNSHNVDAEGRSLGLGTTVFNMNRAAQAPVSWCPIRLPMAGTSSSSGGGADVARPEEGRLMSRSDVFVPSQGFSEGIASLDPSIYPITLFSLSYATLPYLGPFHLG